MAITLRAGATANGIDFRTYFDNFFAKSGNDSHGGNPTFYGDSQYEGEQLALSYTNDRLVLIDGENLEYTFAVHVLSGTIDTVSFGSYGSNYSIDPDSGLLTGTVPVVTISGLDISNPVGVRGDAHTTILGLMGGNPDELLSFVNAEAQIVHGSKGKDVYVGTKFNDKVYGYAGKDTLSGGDGNDVIKGGDGNDTLSGDAGKDKLYGEAGNDILVGGAGKDNLYGGAGKDTFRYLDIADSTVKKNGQDIIRDFDDRDKIDLKAIDADTTKRGDQKFSFLGDTTFTGKAGELVYHVKGNHTYVSGDVDGDGQADFMIDLIGKHTLDKGDFLL